MSDTTTTYLDGRIVAHAPYGQHIDLRCRHHPEKRWSTKNIAPIGARTIFFDLYHRSGDECSCPASDLEPVPESEL